MRLDDQTTEDGSAVVTWWMGRLKMDVNVREDNVLKKDTPVALIVNSDLRDGLIMGAVYTKDRGPAINDEHVTRTTYADGTYVSYNDSSHELTVDNDNHNVKVLYNGGSNKGMLKLVPSLNAWNDTINFLNMLKGAIAGWTPVAQDGGAALKIALGPWLGQTLNTIQQNDVEDPNIKH